MDTAFLAEREHRNLPWPAGPWVMRMAWHELLFAHWAVPAETLAPFLPAGLELDCFEDRAYLGVVPFEMRDVGLWRLPGLPGTRRFLELNLRTYVRQAGTGGVWFFSLDAANRLAVRGARALFHLPYMDAVMGLRLTGSERRYQSRRIHAGQPPAELDVDYRPLGPALPSLPGSLEHWLTERYCLFSADRQGRLYRGDIHHRPWPLQPASAEFRCNTLSASLGLALTEPPASLLFAERLDVVVWPLRRVRL